MCMHIGTEVADSLVEGVRGTLPEFVADKVFFAELNEVLPRELAEDGSSGVEVRVTRMCTEIIIRVPVAKMFLNELTIEGSVSLPRLSHCEFAIQASLRALYPQLIVCRACYGVLRFIVENGAKGA
nr:hypothetical protein [Tanacetum cinerariifolium]